MFERFTDRARRVTVLAQDEARQLHHNYIGTEHILLGLIHEGEGVASKVLDALGVSLEGVRQKVVDIIGVGNEMTAVHVPFTPRAKKVLELSLREALQLGHNYIGTEHILLGLIREGEGVAAQVLSQLGCELTTVREKTIEKLASYRGLEIAPINIVDPSAEPHSHVQQILLCELQTLSQKLAATERERARLTAAIAEVSRHLEPPMQNIPVTNVEQEAS